MTKPAAHIKHTTGRQKLVSIVPTIAQHVNRLACTLLARRGTIGHGALNTQQTAASRPERAALSHSKFPVAGIPAAHGYGQDGRSGNTRRTTVCVFRTSSPPLSRLKAKGGFQQFKQELETMSASKGHTAPTSKAAPAITTTKQPLDSETWCELQNLNDIVNLCAFAADARRTLEGIDEVRHWHPEVGERINARVVASCNWDTHHDTLPNVLAHVNARLHSLLTAGEGME